MVYAAASLSLALLEIMVNLEDYKRLREQYMVVQARFSEDLAATCRVETPDEEAVRLLFQQHGSPTERIETATYRFSIEGTSIQARYTGDWTISPPPRSTQVVGDRWAEQGVSAALKVPSAVVPGEYNYLFNPRHSRFDEIKVSDPREVPIDPRLADG